MAVIDVDANVPLVCGDVLWRCAVCLKLFVMKDLVRDANQILDRGVLRTYVRGSTREL